MDRLRTGILAGLSAGIVMGIVSLLFYQTGIFNLNPFTVMARLFLSDAQAATSTGLVIGLFLHLAAAAFYGTVFTFLIHQKENALYWGITYGTILYFINAGVLGPALGLFQPLWQVDLPNNIGALVTRILYGAVLGYLVHIWLREPVEEGGEHH